MIQGESGVCCLLLDPDLRIRAASREYERVTLRKHGELPGQYLFEAFPDNPKDPHADGTAMLASSLETAMRTGHTHTMRMQRYDIPDPAAPDEFLPKVWSPTNSPLLDHGVDWDPPDLLHTLEALSSVESGRHLHRQQELATENKQLMRAIATRDMIGQAKGILMERFNIGADRAFGLLTRLSQETNTRVEEIARNLVHAERPPRSG